METINLPLIIDEKSYMSDLIIYADGANKLFEVVNIKPFSPRIKAPYLFIPNQNTRTLSCSRAFRNLDIIVTDAIELAVKEKCKELNISIFE